MLAEKIGHFPHELRRMLAAQVWNRFLHRHNLEFSDESKQHLLDANDILRNNSVVVYVNHTAIRDAELSISMVLNFLTNAKRIIGPAGMKHYDFTRDRKNAMLFRLLKPLGISIMPVVQQDDATIYDDEKKARMVEQLKAATQETMKLPGSVYGIAPEGTRSPDGQLMRGKKGIGYLESYNPDLYYLPVAIVYGTFSKQPEITVGKPLSLNGMIPEGTDLPKDPKDKAQFLTDIHMGRLASLLPENMRGVYRGK